MPRGRLLAKSQPFGFVRIHLRNLAAVDKAVRAKQHNSASLADGLQLDRRTIHRYFALLRELGAPLTYSVSTNCFLYTRSWDFKAALLKWIGA